jgi:hypothetical protein
MTRLRDTSVLWHDIIQNIIPFKFKSSGRRHKTVLDWDTKTEVSKNSDLSLVLC